MDTEAVAEFASKLPNVKVAKTYSFFCSDPGQKIIKDDIENQGINRVVIAACTPKIHEPTYRTLLQSAGLSPYFLEMVNLREHCSWVHMADPQAATEKAKKLVAAGVARARLLEDVPQKRIPVEPAVMVIGGGIAGISAALSVANQGIKVYLVEKEATIGGLAVRLDRTFPTDDCAI